MAPPCNGSLTPSFFFEKRFLAPTDKGEGEAPNLNRERANKPPTRTKKEAKRNTRKKNSSSVAEKQTKGQPSTKGKKQKAEKANRPKKGANAKACQSKCKHNANDKTAKKRAALGYVIPYVNIELVYALRWIQETTAAPCASPRFWSSQTGENNRSGYLAFKAKKAGEHKFLRKQREMDRCSRRFVAPQMVVSDHAKQRFRQRGKYTIPVYKDGNSKVSATVVVTYLPYGRRSRRRSEKQAHETIRLQLDHMKKYALCSSRWPRPRLPRYDSLIWGMSKKYIRKATAKRRDERFKRTVPPRDTSIAVKDSGSFRPRGPIPSLIKTKQRSAEEPSSWRFPTHGRNHPSSTRTTTDMARVMTTMTRSSVHTNILTNGPSPSMWTSDGGTVGDDEVRASSRSTSRRKSPTRT